MDGSLEEKEKAHGKVRTSLAKRKKELEDTQDTLNSSSFRATDAENHPLEREICSLKGCKGL